MRSGLGQVRLIGVRSPAQSDDIRMPESVLNRAGSVLQVLAVKRTVIVETDIRERDNEGCLLAYVWLDDGSLLNAVVIRSGYAIAIPCPPNIKYGSKLQRMQIDAIDHGRGIWEEPPALLSNRPFWPVLPKSWMVTIPLLAVSLLLLIRTYELIGTLLWLACKSKTCKVDYDGYIRDLRLQMQIANQPVTTSGVPTFREGLREVQRWAGRRIQELDARYRRPESRVMRFVKRTCGQAGANMAYRWLNLMLLTAMLAALVSDDSVMTASVVFLAMFAFATGGLVQIAHLIASRMVQIRPRSRQSQCSQYVSADGASSRDGRSDR